MYTMHIAHAFVSESVTADQIKVTSLTLASVLGFFILCIKNTLLHLFLASYCKIHFYLAI